MQHRGTVPWDHDGMAIEVLFAWISGGLIRFIWKISGFSGGSFIWRFVDIPW